MNAMTPLEVVAGLWRLKQTNPAEYKRLIDRWHKAIEKASSAPNPWFALMEKRAKGKRRSPL